MMPERSFDWRRMKEACAEFNGPNFDYEGWIANHYNIMYTLGEDVGLLTFDFPGVYTGHWFFKSRGRQALDVATAMLEDAFELRGAKAVRGITPIHLKGALWLAKRIGFSTVGTETWPDGEECEVMVLTKDAFNQRKQNG